VVERGKKIDFHVSSFCIPLWKFPFSLLCYVLILMQKVLFMNLKVKAFYNFKCRYIDWIEEWNCSFTVIKNGSDIGPYWYCFILFQKQSPYPFIYYLFCAISKSILFGVFIDPMADNTLMQTMQTAINKLTQ